MKFFAKKNNQIFFRHTALLGKSNSSPNSRIQEILTISPYLPFGLYPLMHVQSRDGPVNEKITRY